MNEMPAFPTEIPKFIDELRQPPNRKIRWNWQSYPKKNELNLRTGLWLNSNFPDPDNLLDTAYTDFTNFAKNNRICGNGTQLSICKVSDLSGEDFAITVNTNGILLEAGCSEGVRRGMYRIITLLREQSHPGLPFQDRKITRYWLKNRISRCFFSPIKRPPFFRDELIDDQEYYPDNYLSRLAESGVNGLWVTVVLNEMNNSPAGRKRFAKLNRNIRQCSRYGIKIWAFAIEPQGWSETNPPPLGANELIGPPLYNRWNSFCPNSPKAQKWLYNGVYKLFSQAPDLGGMITISHGERVTSCLSCISLYSNGAVPCERHCGLNPAEIISKVLEPMKQAIMDAAPKAQLISWLYMPHPDQISDWIYQLPEGMPPEVIMVANFESGCAVRQLGKMRNGGDYWLSTAGPSERYARLAEHRKPYPIGAKIQVGCSHECATVPFIPVPGQLYRKYRQMKKLGVTTVMQCWYFGNFPGVMNNAAGLLATQEVELDEQEFLIKLAAPNWGQESSEIAQVWEKFAAAYEYYPLDIQFQYYGPMHDGPVWPLYPTMANQRLPQSWKPYVNPAGDAIGECIGGHTLSECVALTGRMSELWHEGAVKFKKCFEKHHDDPERIQDWSIVQALDVQFNSGYNILNFYALRHKWLITKNELFRSEMVKIINKEISNSEKLLRLCEQDNRLGYHSEAEVFKYFPAKLAWRINELRKIDIEDFVKIKSTETIHYPQIIYHSGNLSWQAIYQNGELIFEVECCNEEIPDESLRFFFADRYFVTSPWHDLVVRRDRRPPDDNIERQTVTRPQLGAIRDNRQIAKVTNYSTSAKWQVTLRIPHAAINCDLMFHFGIQHDCAKLWGTVTKENFLDSYPSNTFHQEDRLGLSFFSPEKVILFSLQRQFQN